MEDRKLLRKTDQARKIIEKEIKTEIGNKQRELMQINERIEKVLRNLCILKYVASVGYFENNALNGEADGEVKPQMQIHPAVKRLLPSRAVGRQGPSAPHTSCLEGDIAVKVAQRAQSPHTCIAPLKAVSDVNSPRGTKEKFRLVVGNISKWLIPETREDHATHKWMVYIRDQEANAQPSVLDLIRKVRYFLHESFKPHDIVDVSSPPFSLTRRGWGEFPVRVQLHFVNPVNKPVDIVHSLKLDMTCTGVQTLGSETVVDVMLHNAVDLDCAVVGRVVRTLSQTYSKFEMVESEPKGERAPRPAGPSAPYISSIVAAEHDYFLPRHKPRGVEPLPSKLRPVTLSDTRLRTSSNISGILSTICTRGEVSADRPVASDLQSKYIMKAVKKKYLVDFVGKMQATGLTGVEGLLRWLHQQWPLVTKRAEDDSYRYLHPYSCPSEEAFYAGNIGKQRSAEWYRAKLIQKILTSVKSTFEIHEEIWSTKQIMLWARYHGFSPLPRPPRAETGSKWFNSEAEPPEPSGNTYERTNSYFTSDILNLAFGSDDSRVLNTIHVELDVVGEEKDALGGERRGAAATRLVADVRSPACSFTLAATRQLGIRLQQEDLEADVSCDVALLMISRCLRVFLEDLVRKALARACLRQTCSTAVVVCPSDVVAVLLEEPKFDLLTNSGLELCRKERAEEVLRLTRPYQLHWLLDRFDKSVLKRVCHRRNLAWQYLRLAQDENRFIRLRAVRSLAELPNLTDPDCRQLAQACDFRTAVGLARVRGGNLKLLLDPPYFRLKPDRRAIVKHLHEFMLSLDSDGKHPCLQYFISKTFTDVSDKSFDDDLVLTTGQPGHISICLKQILHHSSIGSNARDIVTLGGLPLLTEMYKYFVQEDPDNVESLVALARLMSNISVFDDCAKDLFVSGWVKILLMMAKHADLRVSSPAARALHNLDHDDVLAGERVTYHMRVYPLNPLGRPSSTPKMDVVFIHGLLGSVFITWRQRDPHVAPKSALGLLGFVDDSAIGDEEGSRFVSHDSYRRQRDDDEVGDFEVVLNDLPIDSSPGATGPFLLDSSEGEGMRGCEAGKLSKCWPRDWLAKDCPDVRIIGINYETNISMWTPMCIASQSKRDLRDRSSVLMQALLKAGVGSRPIVWVCHSMGGLIVKDMLVRAATEGHKNKLCENTKGIVFFSTPHKGSHIAMLNPTSQLILWPSTEVQALRKDSPDLLALHEDFLQIMKKHPAKVVTFAEREATYITALKFELRFVDDESAEADVGELFGVPLDHLQICKPFCRHSFIYQKILTIIKQILSDE